MLDIVKLKGGFFGEGFEPVEVKMFQFHMRPAPVVSSTPLSSAFFHRQCQHIVAAVQGISADIVVFFTL